MMEFTTNSKQIDSVILFMYLFSMIKLVTIANLIANFKNDANFGYNAECEKEKKKTLSRKKGNNYSRLTVFRWLWIK